MVVWFELALQDSPTIAWRSWRMVHVDFYLMRFYMFADFDFARAYLEAVKKQLPRWSSGSMRLQVRLVGSVVLWKPFNGWKKLLAAVIIWVDFDGSSLSTSWARTLVWQSLSRKLLRRPSSPTKSSFSLGLISSVQTNSKASCFVTMAGQDRDRFVRSLPNIDAKSVAKASSGHSSPKSTWDFGGSTAICLEHAVPSLWWWSLHQTSLDSALAVPVKEMPPLVSQTWQGVDGRWITGTGYTGCSLHPQREALWYSGLCLEASGSSCWTSSSSCRTRGGLAVAGHATTIRTWSCPQLVFGLSPGMGRHPRTMDSCPRAVDEIHRCYGGSIGPLRPRFPGLFQR